ncbi:synaptonemal complex protein 2-like isoform X2 [Narcine bancroftii]|uniref:synaptonemal complex protein 2-like isoform X2 n=1 Tax=Narcine bancroftii TaxID=1343680 RepID=UPI0038319F4C
MEFLKTAELKSNESLITLVEDIFDTILAICKCSDEGQIQLLDSFILQIGHGVTDFHLKINIRLEAVRTFNSILNFTSREGKIKFHLSKEAHDLMFNLAKTILDVGDYEIQVAISEALCRMTDKKTREAFIYKWFDERNANAFKKIKDVEFETDCRKFLNQLNSSLFNKRRVYTYPCNSAFLDLNELKMPVDDKLENFWIDFNLGSRSVTFFIKDDVQCCASDLWETVSLPSEGVKNFAVEEVNAAIILIINLKGMLLVNKREGKKVKIYFDSAFDILNATKLVYGEEKMLKFPLPSEDSLQKTTDVATKEMNVKSSTAETSEVVPAVSDGELDKNVIQMCAEEQRCNSDMEREHLKPLKKPLNVKSLSPFATSKSRLQNLSDSVRSKDLLPAQSQKNGNNEDVQHADAKEGQAFDNVFSRTPSNQSSSKDTHPPMEIESKQDVEDAEMQMSDEKLNLTSKHERMKSKLHDVFEFDSSSDSAGKLQVHESKTKLLGKRSSSWKGEMQNVEVASASKKWSREEKVMRKRRSQKFFTEDSWSEESGYSWLSMSHVKALPNVADYSKRKKRKKSALRVLPLSSESSEDQEQKSKEITLRKRFEMALEEHDISPDEQVSPECSDHQASPVPNMKRVKPASFSVGADLKLLTPPDTLQKITLPSIKISVMTSTKEQIPATEEMSGDAGQQSANSPSTKYLNDVISMDDVEQTPFPHYKPKRLFTSEKYQRTGGTLGSFLYSPAPDKVEQLSEQAQPELEDSCLSNTNISAAFHSFTEGVRKLELCYRSIEHCSRQSLKSSEEKFSELMNQIHMCRVQKLSTFETIIAKELKSLEEDTQTLKNWEEENLSFWKQQTLKLSQFYKKQQQRINMLMSSEEDNPGIPK